jgi:hypothetical protein
MISIHPLSDLHNEFELYEPKVLGADVVLLVGDIDVKSRGVQWASEAFPNSRVLYTPGNHEYYGGQLEHTLRKMREAAALTPNVTIMDRDEVVIGGVRFLGATGWTDFTSTGSLQAAQYDAQQTMRDFKKIRTAAYSKTRPLDFIKENHQTKSWLKDKLAEPFAGKTVVFTHHAPLMELIEDHPHSGTHIDSCYANRWNDLMGEGVDLWFSGHTHMAMDMMVDGTRNISNQRGYPGEVIGFNPDLVITL